MEERAWKSKDIIWWPVETEGQAKQAVFVCLIFACYYAFTWTITTVDRLSSLSGQGYFNVIEGIVTAIFFPTIIILIAWGLLKIKRVAAIAGFSFFFFQFMSSGYQIITDSTTARWETSTLFRSIFIAFIFIQGIRGASSYERLRQNNITSTIIEN